MESCYDKMMKTTPYLPFYLGNSLTEAVIAKAREELGETEEVRAKTIPQLKRLVQAEPGLSCPTDDAFLLWYLRARKFNVQKAFSLLQTSFKVKRSNSDICGSFDLQTLKKTFDQKIGYYLPYRDKDGCVIGIIKMRKWDVDVTNAAEALTSLLVAGLWVLQEPATQICGIRLLIDVEGTNLKQIRSLIPKHINLLARAFTSCLPMRVKGVHLYNESPIFRHLISFLKLFLTEKLKNRFHLHGDNLEDLHKHIPKAILSAEDFGGDNTNDVVAWNNGEVEKHFEMYRQFTTYGYKN